MLDNIKSMLGLDPCDTDLNEKLSIMFNHAKARLKNRLGGIEPPAELEYIVTELVIVRFNRIGSEGLDNHSVEGEAMTFTADDLAQYEKDIQAWLDRQENGTRGKLRFI